MATYVPAKRATEFIFYIGLRSQADSTILQANPTIAAGDFKVSIDGGALANPATLPAVTPASSKMVKVTLSTSEMTGDNITLIASDAAGAEWMDLIVNIQTTARQIDDLAFPTVSGRSLDVSAGGEAGVDWANVGSPTTVVGLSGTTVKTATDVETDTADIQTQIGAAGAGLTAINLPDQTMNITGNITGNLSGSVGSVTTVSDKTGYRLDATGSAALTEGYAADGAAATLPQLLYMLLALLSEFSISGTTLTAKKLDGSTAAATFTLDSSTAPTSITRAT